jgi:hypothetical protein
MAELRHFEQSAATSLLYIIAMRSEGKDIEWGRRHVSRERIQIGWSGWQPAHHVVYQMAGSRLNFDRAANFGNIAAVGSRQTFH